MYGADFSTNAGNTVYSWTPAAATRWSTAAPPIAPGGNRIFATIWDGGGTDTYDLSGYTTNLDSTSPRAAIRSSPTAQRAALGDGNSAPAATSSTRCSTRATPAR